MFAVALVLAREIAHDIDREFDTAVAMIRTLSYTPILQRGDFSALDIGVSRRPAARPIARQPPPPHSHPIEAAPSGSNFPKETGTRRQPCRW